MKERSKTKQLAINMTAQMVSFVTSGLISFLLTPYIVKHIGSEAYGFVGLANNFISYVTIITVALNSMSSRFITIAIHQNKEKSANQYFSSVVIANVIVSVPLSVVLVFVVVFLDRFLNISSGLVFDVKLMWALLFLNFLLGLVFNVFSVATFARNRLDLSSLRSIESNLIKVAILLLMFFLFKPSVWFLGFATLISGIYVYFTNVYYTKKLLPEISVKKEYLDVSKIKELLSAGVWNSVSHLSSTLSNGLDLLITNLFVTATAMGTVSVAKTIPNVILSAFGIVSSVFMPDLTISYAKNDFKDVRKQLLSSIRFLSFFVSIPLAFMFVYGKEFYTLWVPTQDAKTLYILSVICMIAAPFGWALEPLWNVFTVTNKVKQSSLFLMFNAFLSTVLVFVFLHFTNNETVKMCIIIGMSTFVSIIRNLTFLPIYGAKCVGLKKTTFHPIIIKNVLTLFAIVLLSFVIKLFIIPKTWLMLVVCVIIISVVSALFGYAFILNKDDRAFIKDKLFSIISGSN